MLIESDWPKFEKVTARELFLENACVPFWGPDGMGWGSKGGWVGVDRLPFELKLNLYF